MELLNPCRLPAFPTEIAFSVIEEELGRPVKELFLEISERPVAAASLGQVRLLRISISIKRFSPLIRW